MRYHVHSSAEATERVDAHSREDLRKSYVRLGNYEHDMESAISVGGTAAERADFLRRLAAAATAEANQLVPPVDDEPDGAPCCPDPGCTGRAPGQPCTFPGYVEGN
jgi:hypothetical protein